MNIDPSNGFLVYKTTGQDMDSALEIYRRSFEKSNLLNSKTVYDRKGSRIAGILGEIVFQKYMGSFGNKSLYDLSYDFLVCGKKVDVKCKYRTVVPRPTFEASLFAYQVERHFYGVDYYVFLSTLPDFKTFWFCGMVSRSDWLSNTKGKIWKAGDVDPSNNKRFDADTWSIFYKDLNPVLPNPEKCFV